MAADAATPGTLGQATNLALRSTAAMAITPSPTLSLREDVATKVAFLAAVTKPAAAGQIPPPALSHTLFYRMAETAATFWLALVQMEAVAAAAFADDAAVDAAGNCAAAERSAAAADGVGDLNDNIADADRCAAALATPVEFSASDSTATDRRFAPLLLLPLSSFLVIL